MSFFSINSAPTSPLPCPISPCRSDSLSMENDFVDFNSFINKDKKPFSPARKRLNMDALASTTSPSKLITQVTTERHHLQSISENVSPFGIRVSSSGAFKRTECFPEDSQSPVQNKRFRGENQSPVSSSIFSPNHQPALRKTVSIMNVLTSSSEMLKLNRL